MMNNWYVATPDGKEIMLAEDELLAGVSTGQYAAGTLIWREGLEAWEPIENHFPEAFRKQASTKSLFTKRRCLFGAVALLCMCFLLSLCGEKQSDSAQQDVAAAVKEIQWYVGKGDWANLHAAFEHGKDAEVYSCYYYSDGVSKEKPDELTEEQLNYRAWSSLWSGCHPNESFRDLWSGGEIASQIRDIKEKLRYAHPSEAGQLNAVLAQLQEIKLANFIQFEVCETMHMATFLAAGDVNESLSAVTALVCQMSNDDPDNVELSFYAKCLNDLRKSARLVSAAIPWDSQLYIVDEYERKLKERSRHLELYHYESPQELVVLRNQLRIVIKRKMSESKK